MLLKRSLKIFLMCIVLGGVLMFGLSGCFGKKYHVDYCGGKGYYSNARDYYRAGANVKLYFEMVATDTDYHFYLDDEPIDFEYDERKGFVIEFTMPEHDVKLDFISINSMLPPPDWNQGLG